MKKLFIILIFFNFIHCEKDISPLKPVYKYFDPNNLINLSLDTINYFWQNDTIRTQSDPIAHFRHSYGYLKGLELVGKRRSIRIFVFKTNFNAISSMEEYRTLNSRITSKGDENKYIKEK